MKFTKNDINGQLLESTSTAPWDKAPARFVITATNKLAIYQALCGYFMACRAGVNENVKFQIKTKTNLVAVNAYWADELAPFVTTIAQANR